MRAFFQKMKGRLMAGSGGWPDEPTSEKAEIVLRLEGPSSRHAIAALSRAVNELNGANTDEIDTWDDDDEILMIQEDEDWYSEGEEFSVEETRTREAAEYPWAPNDEVYAKPLRPFDEVEIFRPAVAQTSPRNYS